MQCWDVRWGRRWRRGQRGGEPCLQHDGSSQCWTRQSVVGHSSSLVHIWIIAGWHLTKGTRWPSRQAWWGTCQPRVLSLPGGPSAGEKSGQLQKSDLRHCIAFRWAPSGWATFKESGMTSEVYEKETNDMCKFGRGWCEQKSWESLIPNHPGLKPQGDAVCAWLLRSRQRRRLL